MAAGSAYRCSRCGITNDKLLICSRCLSVYYCSPECQRKDWKEKHKILCDETVQEQNREITEQLRKVVMSVHEAIMQPLIAHLKSHPKYYLQITYMDDIRKPGIDDLKYSVMRELVKSLGVLTDSVRLPAAPIKLTASFIKIQIRDKKFIRLAKPPGYPVVISSTIGNATSSRVFRITDASGVKTDQKWAEK